jgi:hypothetical protein
MAFKLPASLTRPNKKKPSKDLLWEYSKKVCGGTGLETNQLYYMLEPYSYNYMRVDTSMQAAEQLFGKDQNSDSWLEGVTRPRDASIEKILGKIAKILDCDKYRARAVYENKFPTNLDYIVLDKLSNDGPAIEWFINNTEVDDDLISAAAACLAEEEAAQTSAESPIEDEVEEIITVGLDEELIVEAPPSPDPLRFGVFGRRLKRTMSDGCLELSVIAAHKWHNLSLPDPDESFRNIKRMMDALDIPTFCAVMRATIV